MGQPGGPALRVEGECDARADPGGPRRLTCARRGCDAPAAFVPRLVFYGGGCPTASEALGTLALCAAHRGEVAAPEDLLGPGYLAFFGRLFGCHGLRPPTSAAIDWERVGEARAEDA